jgi:hypothetical protein
MNYRPRGIRNNNPGNIRDDGTQWRGVKGNDGAFCVFDTPENGIRAIAKILKSYQSKGIDTIHEIINRWAPPSENNTTAYVCAVAEECGINADKLITSADWPEVIAAIIRHENGQQPYTKDQILTGIGAAA